MYSRFDIHDKNFIFCNNALIISRHLSKNRIKIQDFTVLILPSFSESDFNISIKMQSIINSTYFRNNNKLHNEWAVTNSTACNLESYASPIRGSSTSQRSSLSWITIEISIFNPVSWRSRCSVTAWSLRSIKILIDDLSLLAVVAHRLLCF